ncbi:MAG: triose-phosphate isomerase [Nanoarchaeota archaeon]
MKLPVIIVNFKATQGAVGAAAVRLAKICDRVAKQTKASVAVAVQATDLAAVAKAVSIPVLAQHVDPVDLGSYTGHVPPRLVKMHGAAGTLLNHSEHRLPKDVLRNAIRKARAEGLWVCACANTPADAAAVAKLGPDAVAIEPPELIGGTVSVSVAHPSILTRTTHAIKKIPVLCGAGVHTTQDVIIARKLHTKGILVASGITKAKNPAKALRELIAGL